jgi:flavin-dependent dehydrogenase
MSSSLPSSVDVVIVGAGPGGSTTAAILAKYRPNTSVLVLERQDFPRYKIGESLIIDINRVLADMGALPAVDAAGFTHKYGVTFVWGGERVPKTFFWQDGTSLVRPPVGYHLDYTYHVDRPRYDQILLDCAASHGVTVAHGQEVTEVLREDGRVVGVRARGADGAESEVRARYVIDAAGGQGPMSREGTVGRKLDEDLRNIAVYGYYRNVKPVDHLTGLEEHRRTTLITTPQGWVWVIPLSNGITSVGFVTSVANFRAANLLDPREYHEAMLRSLPEYDLLFGEAELVDYRNDGRMIHSVREYSYSCEQVAGPGWATVGDAGGFVDAILSIGCFVAQNHAQFLAYALATVLDDPRDEALAFSSYATTLQENLRAFRAVAHMFYAFNPDMTVWWQECSTRLRASNLVPNDDDRTAFAAFFTGFAARSSLYESALDAFSGPFLVEVSEGLFGSNKPFEREKMEGHSRRAQQMTEGDPVLRFAAPYKTRPFLLPRSGAGRLEKAIRLDLELELTQAVTTPEGQSREAVARRIYLPALAAAIPGLIDGRRSVSQIIEALAAANPGVTKQECAELVHPTVGRLAGMGALEPASAGAAAIVVNQAP